MNVPATLEPTLQVEPDPRGLGGLLALVESAEKPLPLRDVHVRAEVVGPICRATIVQRFANPYDQPLEVVHLFPLPEDGAVVELELIAGDVVVRAECRERKEAEARFAEAREAGHRAALMTAERDDIHTLRATNIPPGEEVQVRIVVVESLEVVDSKWRWRFPTTIAPRFLPGEATSHEGPGVVPDTDVVPDASRLQPPLRLSGGTTLDLEVSLAAPVSQLACSQHGVTLTLDGTVRVAPKAATLDRDFVLAFQTGAPADLAARAWTDGAHTVVAVEPPTVALPTAMPREAVFVVDRSGSMRGGKMDAAKRALKMALRGLETTDRFALIAFDSTTESFRDGPVPVTEDHLVAADRWIDGLRASGGTMMAPALRAAFAGERSPGALRTVLFVTDGQAHNEAELIGLVHGRREGARLFTMGIDSAVNGAMLKRLARVGRGTCELMTPSDDIEARVTRLEVRFGSPVLQDVVIPGAAALEPGVVFAGRPLLALVEGAPETVEVSARGADGPVSLSVQPRPIEVALAPVWARARVAALEDRLVTRPFEEEATRPEILRIALAHGIASRYTAFVVVETRRTVDGERIEVVQPHALPAGWDPAFAAPPAGGPGRIRRKSYMGRSPRASMSFACALAPPVPMQEALATSGAAPPDGLPIDRAATPEVDACALDDTGHFAVPKRAMRAHRGVAAGASPARGPVPAPVDPAARLAAAQGADGSFGGDVRRTAAALLALVLLGHGSRRGLRQRTVRKAAAFLRGHAGDPVVDAALAALAMLDSGGTPDPDASWDALAEAGAEGQIFAAARAG